MFHRKISKDDQEEQKKQIGDLQLAQQDVCMDDIPESLQFSFSGFVMNCPFYTKDGKSMFYFRDFAQWAKTLEGRSE